MCSAASHLHTCPSFLWNSNVNLPNDYTLFSSELSLGVWEFLCSNMLLQFSVSVKFTERYCSCWREMSLKTLSISNEILVWVENPHNIQRSGCVSNSSEIYVGCLDIGPAHISHIRSRTFDIPFPVSSHRDYVNKALILSIVLYGCETSSVALSKE